MARVLCLFVMLMIISRASAQLEIGARAGLNISDIVITNYIDPDAESMMDLKLGPHVGVFIRGFREGERVGFAGELQYSNKGVKAGNNINLHYVAAPLLFIYRITDRIHAEFGPEPAYLLAARSAIGDMSSTYSRRFDLGLDAGIVLDLPTLMFGLRYGAGFFSVTETGTQSQFPGEKVRYQNRVLQISAGVKLWRRE